MTDLEILKKKKDDRQRNIKEKGTLKIENIKKKEETLRRRNIKYKEMLKITKH